MGSIFSFGSRKTTRAMPAIDWETRSDGTLIVAIVNNVPVAGISGPWPDGKYALTWWSTHDSDAPPTLEFHPTKAIARQRIEDVSGRECRVA